MLPAAHRLRRSSDFAVAIRGGRRVGRGTLVVHLAVHSKPEEPGRKPLPGSSASSVPARVGFVVAKTVGNAVVRNTVKRRLRHLMSARVTELPEYATIVVRALPAAASAPYRQLELDLDAALAAAQRPRRADRGPR